MLRSVNISKSNSEENLTREELDRLTPALIHLKLNQPCEKTMHGHKWKSTEKDSDFSLHMQSLS